MTKASMHVLFEQTERSTVSSGGLARAELHVAGDVIITGTPGGVGAARKPPVFMLPGDVFEVEVEGMGVLSNPVQDG